MKQGCSHWPAIAKWTPEYLSQTVQQPVSVALTPNGLADSILGQYFTLPYTAQMPISDFFDLIQSRPAYCQQQNSSFETEFSQLKDDICMFDLPLGPLDAINMWIGNESSTTSMHKDPYENIYCVVSGRKMFTLLPPSDAPFLYTKFYPVAKYCQDMTLEPLHGQSIPWSPIDPDDPDLSRYPLFANATVYQVEVEAGDILYLPAFWFHKVKQSGLTIAVNFWYDVDIQKMNSLLPLD
jgi:jumonji domain-containing protein 7